MQFLRHQADGCPRRAVVSHGVVAVSEDGAGSGIDDAADDANQCRLARPIGSEQGEYLAAFYVQVDVFERLETAGIGLVNAAHEDDGDGIIGGHSRRCGHFFMDECKFQSLLLRVYKIRRPLK